jgi:hypothetical protein
MRGIKETQEHKLGDAQGIPSSYSKTSQATKLGDAQGIPPFFSNNYRLVSVEPKCLLVHMMCAILGCVFVLLAVWIKCQDLKLLLRESPCLATWLFSYSLDLRLYIFGVVCHLLICFTYIFLSTACLVIFVERLSCFTYTFLRDRNFMLLCFT